MNVKDLFYNGYLRLTYNNISDSVLTEHLLNYVDHCIDDGFLKNIKNVIVVDKNDIHGVEQYFNDSLYITPFGELAVLSRSDNSIVVNPKFINRKPLLWVSIENKINSVFCHLFLANAILEKKDAFTGSRSDVEDAVLQAIQDQQSSWAGILKDPNDAHSKVTSQIIGTLYSDMMCKPLFTNKIGA